MHLSTFARVVPRQVAIARPLVLIMSSDIKIWSELVVPLERTLQIYINSPTLPLGRPGWAVHAASVVLIIIEYHPICLEHL